VQIAANQEPRHNSLAGAGIFSQQKAQRLPRQHFFIDGANLVGQRFRQGGMNWK
jgi:hypothetical protein